MRVQRTKQLCASTSFTTTLGALGIRKVCIFLYNYDYSMTMRINFVGASTGSGRLSLTVGDLALYKLVVLYCSVV